MHLSKMDLNPARRESRLLLASPQRLHAAVLAGFPPDTATADDTGRVLWRVDRHDHRATLYATSPGRPDFTHLVEQAGWPTQSTWRTQEYDPFLGRLTRGQRWFFRLTANPVHHVRSKDGEPTKPIGHVTAHHQQEWLMSRMSKLGFRVVDDSDGVPGLVVSGRRDVAFARGDSESRHRVRLVVATFEGVLEIEDADALREALTHGIGRARGYGCGLMTLAPAR